MPRPRRPPRRTRPKITYDPTPRVTLQQQYELMEGGQQAADRWRREQSAKQTPYDDVLLGGAGGRAGYDAPLRRQYNRQYRHLAPGADRTLIPTKGDQLRRDLQLDRALLWGNEDQLVPHSTQGQTINPSRPRTRAIGYDAESRELRIKFRDGARYVYYDVPPDVWEELLSADSIGIYMNDHIVHSYTYDQETYNRTST